MKKIISFFTIVLLSCSTAFAQSNNTTAPSKIRQVVSFDENSNVGEIEVYENEKTTASYWFYKGYLELIFSDFQKTKGIVGFDCQCKSIEFYRNGNIQKEGVLLFPCDDHPVGPNSVEYGKWTYYNEDGTISKVVVHELHNGRDYE